tara:strand:- start:3633 stop:4445 length:813 start_codon:yes stop_codon:yes gene_type:complete
MFDLSNKLSIITGGGGFLGREHGLALSKYNSSIILIDLDKKKLSNAKKYILNKNSKAQVEIFNADITNENEIIDIKNILIKNKFKINVLVNNAAIDPKMDKLNKQENNLEEYSVRQLLNEINVGLIGSFICTKIFGSEMVKYKNGSIINIASDLAISGPDQRVYAKTEKIEDVKNFKPIGYPIVKSGLLGLNRYFATYWAHKGVRVNCLVPGAVKNLQGKTLINNIKKRVPMNKLAKKNDYHGAIVFLASEASSYMTGQLLVIDGGRTIW